MDRDRTMRRKWAKDPTVPISGLRLRQALDMAGVSLADLARRLKEKRQTLDYIVRGKTAKCRRSRRAAMARALAVPEDWLGGGDEGGMEWLVARLDGKPQAHRARNRLGRRCALALDRDGGLFPNAVSEILRLTLPEHWRGELLAEDLPAYVLDCEDLTSLERDLAGVALANAFEAILRPWLTGRVKLNRKPVVSSSSTVPLGPWPVAEGEREVMERLKDWRPDRNAED